MLMLLLMFPFQASALHSIFNFLSMQGAASQSVENILSRSWQTRWDFYELEVGRMEKQILKKWTQKFFTKSCCCSSPHLNFQIFGSVVLHVLKWSHAVSARQQGLICRWENRHFGQVELALISNLCASCRNAGEQCWCNHGVLALTCSKLFILLHIAIIQHTYVTHVLEKLWLA